VPKNNWHSEYEKVRCLTGGADGYSPALGYRIDEVRFRFYLALEIIMMHD